jgi:ABC-type phosphate transport system substrate-binding protein
MIKKIIQTAILGGSLLGLAGAANAATIDVNLYGASAQYEFWTAAAPGFLQSQGCRAQDISTAKDSGNVHGIAICRGTEQGGQGFNNNGNTYYLRYSSKASYDGIRAVQGLDPDGDSGSCNDNERLMANEATTDWGTHTVTSLSCKDVTIGASDVAAETFGQQSSGLQYGPKTTSNPTISRSIGGLTMDSSYNVFRPIIVPFAFFRNANPTTPVPYDNMTRLMATSIFNGQVANWSAFNPSNPNADIPVIVCMRHAGSGTVATLDAAVMRGDYTLVTEQIPADDELVIIGLAPAIYFNEGSSDMLRCVGGAGNRAGYTEYTGIGAVGYADGDKVIMSDGTLPAPNNIAGEYHDTGNFGDVKLMKYMGEMPTRNNIVNGVYDFWAAQWLYASPADSGAGSLVRALDAYASNPANIPASKAAFWASQDEMKVEKATDFSFPKFK